MGQIDNQWEVIRLRLYNLAMVDHQPAELTREFAHHFGLSKQELLDQIPNADMAFQTGGAYLPGVLSLPKLALLSESLETRIETFIVSPGGLTSSTGTDIEMIDAWMPSVEALIQRIQASCAEMEIVLEGDSYLTASVTPLPEVIDVPHFDDQQFTADDGVGLVAIVADLDGSCVATEPVPHHPAQPGMPLQVDEAVFASFAAGEIAQQHTDANRVVVFPQFAQLHSGPPLAETETDGVRAMLVFRARSTPIKNQQ